jgi:hypothetical protein
MEKEPEQKTLLIEMIEGLTKDVADLKQLFASKPQATPSPDLESSLDKISRAIDELRDEVGDLNEQRPQTQVLGAESTQILGELQAIRQDIRKSPANRISKVVQYGTGLLLVSVLTTGVLAYYATKWRDERDAFEVSDWKWRVMRQVNAEYATKLDGVFASDSVSEPNKVWIIQQEQADATREAARRAAEQAKVMNAQADELEGKKKGRK